MGTEHLSKEEIQMANKQIRSYATSWITAEMQIKPMMSYDLILIRMAIIQNKNRI